MRDGIALDGYPLMKLTGFHYLIYDTPSLKTERLRASLLREGATVRVTSSIITAFAQLDERCVDAAFVAYRSDPATRSLCFAA
jgi:hypothetical protein